MKILPQRSNSDYSAKTIHGEYYPHIDGIRALAVLPVVLFHILALLCPGGFAGVDVFFVISGYLITGGILRDLGKDRFTIRNFYYRRIRRIMPAYFAMIIGVFVAGCALYYSLPLMSLGDVITAGTLFFANIQFSKMRGDYFAPQIHSQPLLHLWSLSVEEQFYLFIPLICAILWKFRRRLVAPALALLAGLSLTSAICFVMTGKQNSAFYLLPFRAWELLAGSLLAMLPAVACKMPGPRQQIDKWHTFFATAGLLMVLIPYAVLSSKTPFPGAAALSPVLGTALLIRYGQSGWVSRLLSWRPFVGTGKISYSLYLWHWPVTVFWRYATYDQLYVCDYIGMFLLSFALGFLSWKFVELPVRTSPVWTMRRAFSFAAAGIVCLVTLGTACAYFRGWPTILHPRANSWVGAENPFIDSRVHRLIRRIDSTLGSSFSVFHKSVQKTDAERLAWGGGGNSMIGSSDHPEIFLIGDSHAGSLRYGLDAVLRERSLAGYVVSWAATPMFNMELAKSQDALKKLDELPQVSKVILVARWGDYDMDYVQLEKFASYIKSKEKTLFIVQDVPSHKYPLTEIAARMKIIPPRKMEPEWEALQQSEEEYDRMQKGINTRLDEICKKTDAILVPLNLAFKENGHYIYFGKGTGKPLPLFWDTNHFTKEGSLRAAQFMAPYLFPETGLKN